MTNNYYNSIRFRYIGDVLKWRYDQKTQFHCSHINDLWFPYLWHNNVHCLDCWDLKMNTKKSGPTFFVLAFFWGCLLTSKSNHRKYVMSNWQQYPTMVYTSLNIWEQFCGFERQLHSVITSSHGFLNWKNIKFIFLFLLRRTLFYFFLNWFQIMRKVFKSSCIKYCLLLTLDSDRHGHF